MRLLAFLAVLLLAQPVLADPEPLQTITIHVYDRPAFQRVSRELGLPVGSGGWATWSRDRRYCTIGLVRGFKRHLLLHELRHCREGQFHKPMT